MNLKASLTAVSNNKIKEKKLLHELKNNYLTIIYDGISKQEKIESIHKKLLLETINFNKKNKVIDIQMQNISIKFAHSVYKKSLNIVPIKKEIEKKYNQSDLANEVVLGVYVFEMMKKLKVENKMSKTITKNLDKKEGKRKDKILSDMIEEGRKIKVDIITFNDLKKVNIFYLASSHKDSASDHVDYQGKIYIDEKRKELPMERNVREAIMNYINTHQIRTIQWVMGKPVWFVTRPNCRHYFKSLSIADVLDFTATTLLEKNNMTTAIGDREYLQTINHSTSKEFYLDLRNAELLLNSYEERLQLHLSLYKKNPSFLLEMAIEKDKLLIKKWKEYIEKMKSM